MEEAKQVAYFFETLIGKKREKCSSRLWEYGLCRTQGGTEYRMSSLRRVAELYYKKNHVGDAMDMAAQAMAVFEESGFKLNSECRASFVTRRNLLYNANDFDQCLANSQQLMRFLEELTKSDPEPNDTHIRRETQFVLARCFATQGDLTEAQRWYCKAADEAKLLNSENHLASKEPALRWLVEDLALVGQYERSQSTARKVLDIKAVKYSDGKENVAFYNLEFESLVFKLEEIGSIDSDWRDFLRCYQLLMALEELQGRAAEANWWENAVSTLEYRNIPSFSRKLILIRLKSIDTCLHLGVAVAYLPYRALAYYYFLQGDSKAAKLVSSDAASRFLGNISGDLSSGLWQASGIYACTGRYSQRKVLLCSAYEIERNECLDIYDIYDDFDLEISYAGDYLNDLEDLTEHVDLEDMRLSFAEKACEHLLRAISKNHRIREHETRKLDINQDHDDDEDDDEDDDKEEGYRRDRMYRLQSRLQRLGAGPLFDDMKARSEMKAAETRQLRRAKSQELARAVPPPQKGVALDDIYLYTRNRRCRRR